MRCKNPICRQKFKRLATHLSLKDACASFYDRMHDDENADSDMDVESDSDGHRNEADGDPAIANGCDGSETGGSATLDDRVWREVLAEMGVEMLDREGVANDQHLDKSQSPPASFIVEEFKGAGATFERGQNIFEKAETSHPFAAERKKPGAENYPFLNNDEWEVGAWLASAGLSMAKQDEFLNLPWVSVKVASPNSTPSCI